MQKENDNLQIYYALKVLAVLCDRLGGNHHKEAIITNVARYRKAKNYQNIRLVAGCMLRMHELSHEGNKKTIDVDNPEAAARMKVFGLVYEHILELDKNESRCKSVNIPFKPEIYEAIKIRFNRELKKLAEEQSKQLQHADEFEAMVKAIPAKLKEIEEEFAKAAPMPAQLQELITKATEAAQAAVAGRPFDEEIQIIESRLHPPHRRR